MEFFVILDHFCPSPPWRPGKLKFWNIEILSEILSFTPGDIVILDMCTINDNHIMYVSWVMEQNRQNLLSFWAIFCPFIQRIKILKKWKKLLEISSFNTNVPKIMISWCTVPRHGAWRKDGKSDMKRRMPHLKITNFKFWLTWAWKDALLKLSITSTCW